MTGGCKTGPEGGKIIPVPPVFVFTQHVIAQRPEKGPVLIERKHAYPAVSAHISGYSLTYAHSHRLSVQGIELAVGMDVDETRSQDKPVSADMGAGPDPLSPDQGYCVANRRDIRAIGGASCAVYDTHAFKHHIVHFSSPGKHHCRP